MKAALCRRYGPPDVFEIGEIATPAPAAREVQVRVRATTVSVSDTYIRSAVPFASIVPRTMRSGPR